MDLLQKYMNEGKTILGVGPVSRQVVQVTDEISKNYQIPILLICSRRQVESKDIDKSYVMSTEEISKYSSNKYIYLSRDHGSVWQGIYEKDLTFEESFEKCKLSYKKDIENGFRILHIDPSLEKEHDKLQIIYDLIDYCESLSKDIVYEIGTDETNGSLTNTKEFEEFIYKICKYLDFKYSKQPLFVVGQAGTYVREIFQAGYFDSTCAQNLSRICSKYGVYLKEHNCDYIYSEDFSQHNLCKVGAVNIAPELGILQTYILLGLLQERDQKVMNYFIDYVHSKKKWVKWLAENRSQEEMENLKNYTCLIAGHYHFEDDFTKEIIDRLDIKKKINNLWNKALTFRITEILKNLGWKI